jgi:hypothetical protein
MFNLTGTNTTGTATSNSWYSQNQNSSVLINNNNSAGNVVDSSDLIVANYRNDQDKKNYNESIDYLIQSNTFNDLYYKLDSADEVFTVNFNDDKVMSYDYPTKTINYDSNQGLKIKSSGSIQSPALLLSHEMGHAQQDLTGYMDKVYSNYDGSDVNKYKTINIENPNVKLETRIAKELGEPTRQNYDDRIGFVNVDSPTTSKNRS